MIDIAGKDSKERHREPRSDGFDVTEAWGRFLSRRYFELKEVIEVREDSEK